jgi:hypothetical protein
MIQRVANSRKLVLELRQWFPGLLRLKDENDLDDIAWGLDLLGEVEEDVDGYNSSYYYDGVAHLELSVKGNSHLLKDNDSRVLNPKTGRPQVKYLEKFLKEYLQKIDVYIDGVINEYYYWPDEDRNFSLDLKIIKVIPKKDSILVVMHLNFDVQGYLDRNQREDWAKEDDRW